MVRVVLQAGIKLAGEDLSTWDVEAWQKILADLPGGQPEKKEEEKNAGGEMPRGNEGGATLRSEV